MKVAFAALYFFENDPAGASIVAVKVSNQDGTLSDPVWTSTGGKGLIGLNNQGQAVVDTLFSQDAVVVSGTRLLTVNPGTNTVSLFTIPKGDPYHPTLVGEPVYSGGDFPNTVAYNQQHRIACVANSGTRNTVQCYDMTDAGLRPNDEPMPLPLVNQTTPPLGPPNTVSDIVFNPEGSALFVSVKGATGAVGDPGYPTASGSRAFVSDPGFGGAFVDVAGDLRATTSKVVNVTGQAVSCWSQYSQEVGALYVFDGGVADITVLDSVSMDAKPTLTGPATAAGKFDSFVTGEYLYTLDGVVSITAYSLRESRVVQTPDLAEFGNRQFFQGLAFYGGLSC